MSTSTQKHEMWRQKSYFINQAYLSKYGNMPAYRCKLRDEHGIGLNGFQWTVYYHLWWCSTMPHGESIRKDKLSFIYDGNPYHPSFLGGIFAVNHLADNLDVLPEQIEEALVFLEKVGLIVSQTRVSPTEDEISEWQQQKERGSPAYPLPYRNVPPSIFFVKKNEGTPSTSVQKTKQIYFIQGSETKRIKIGYSVNPKARLQSLSASEPLTLLKTIPGNAEEEKKLHKRFQHLRRHGEWFEADEELIQFIKSL